MRLMDWPSKKMASSGRGSSADYAGSRAARRRYQGKDHPDHEPAEPCAGHPGGDPFPSRLRRVAIRFRTVASDTLRLSVRWDRQRRLRREVCEKKTVSRGDFPAIGKADCHSRDITGIFLICGTQEMPCPRPHCVLDLFSGSESIVTPYRCCSPDGLCGRIVGRRQAHARPTRQTRRC